MKLFVIGEYSGDPNDWGGWGSKSLVLAEGPEEAKELVDIPGDAHEVHTDEPIVLATVSPTKLISGG